MRRTQGRRDLAEHWQSDRYLSMDAFGRPHHTSRETPSIRSIVKYARSLLRSRTLRDDERPQRSDGGRPRPLESRARRAERGGRMEREGIEQFEGKGVWIATATYTIDSAASASTQVGLNHIGSDTVPISGEVGVAETAASS